MFFTLSKLVGLAFQPINFLVLSALLGSALAFTRAAKFGRALATMAVVLLAIACWSPLSSQLLRPLEDRFPPPPADMPAPAGIIVLGGALDEDLSAARGQPTITEAGARLTTGVALARRYPEARLVFTGGSSNLLQDGLDEARGVRALWRSLGISDDRMIFESGSRNTYENATMTRRLVAPKPGERWLLLTSAAHMPRSVGIFRHVGWPVVPYPVDYHTFGDQRDWKPTGVAADSLQKLTTAFHEWVGLLAYRLTNKTDALFPGP